MSNYRADYRGPFGFIMRYPRLILAAALLLAALSILYTTQKMEFLTGRDDLMPKNTKFHADYRAYRQEFGDMEDIVVVIESEDQEKAARFGEELYGRLQGDKQSIREVFYPYGLPFFKKNGLLLLPLADLQTLHANLALAKPMIKELAASPSVETLFTSLTTRMDGYVNRGGKAAGVDQELASLAFTLKSLGKGLQQFDGGKAAFTFNEFFSQNANGEESQLAKSGRMQVLTALPVKDNGSFVPAENAIQVIRAELKALSAKPEFKGVTAGLTGTPVLEFEEMATSKRDIDLALVLSIVLTVILLLIAFRGILNVTAAMVSLLIAIAVSFGFATLVIGHLNILSMVFAVMLVGIGVEYGIQLVLRYQEELAGGASELEAIRVGLEKNLWAIVMAAATTAAAFLTFVFTDFKGVAELGIIAGSGIIICVLTTFTVLPAMLVLLAKYRKPASGNRQPGTGKGKRPAQIPGPRSLVPKLKQVLFGQPKVVLAVTVILCTASLYPISRVSFDYNLMNLQAKGLESVEYAYKLMTSAENAGYFAVVSASSAAEAAAKGRALEALPTVDHVVSLNTFVPDDQEQKLRELRAIQVLLADVKPGKYDDALNVMALPTVFENFRNAVERLKLRLAKEGKVEAREVGAFLTTLDAFFARLEKNRDSNARGMLEEFQGGMLASLPEKIAFLKESLAAAPVKATDIPPELRSRFVGKTGQYLIQVAPKGTIFDLAPLKRFIEDIRSVDANVTGEPIMVYESMTIMRDAYRWAFFYAFLAIIVILLITFRSLKYAGIGLLTLVIGLFFMISGMWLFGISFNSANIIVMPLVLGVGIDSGIYIINRFRREHETAVEVVTRSAGQGVIFNTLTILASFGALMVAHHQGVFSIGAVMSLGMVACLIAFIIVLPALLTLAGKR